MGDLDVVMRRRRADNYGAVGKVKLTAGNGYSRHINPARTLYRGGVDQAAHAAQSGAKDKVQDRRWGDLPGGTAQARTDRILRHQFRLALVLSNLPPGPP